MIACFSDNTSLRRSEGLFCKTYWIGAIPEHFSFLSLPYNM